MRRILLLLLLAPALRAQTADRGWQHGIRGAHSPAVVFVTVIAKLDNGGIEQKTGTGFIVHPDGYVLTCNHVLPSGSDYVSIKITGAPGGRYEYSYPLTIVERKPGSDLALLRFPKAQVAWPFITTCDRPAVTEDTSVYVMGYPGEQDLIGVSGSITSLSGDAGRWITDAAINQGMSGGPVFTQEGAVIGLAAAGYSSAQLLNQVIPLPYAFDLLGMTGPDTCRTAGSAKTPSLSVAAVPDTVSITPNKHQAVAYEFVETGGVDVQVDTQDAQFYTLSGVPLSSKSCKGCRILGGTFKVPTGGRHTLWDNVLLPGEVVEEAQKLGAPAVNLRTTFNARFGKSEPLQVTAVLTIFPLMPPVLTGARVNFHTTDNDKDANTTVRVAIRCGATTVADVEQAFGKFPDHTDSGWKNLLVRQAVTRDDLATGCAAELTEKPVGHDEWHFEWAIELAFSDGTAKRYDFHSGNVDYDRPTITEPLSN